MNGIKPWAYRPQEYDDWGVIRDADGDLTARAVGGEFYRADAHREAGTDPVGDRAKAIVRAVNCHDDLVTSLDRLIGEVNATIGAFEHEMRQAMGNTNYQIICDRVIEARADLAKVEQPA